MMVWMCNSGSPSASLRPLNHVSSSNVWVAARLKFPSRLENVLSEE